MSHMESRPPVVLVNSCGSVPAEMDLWIPTPLWNPECIIPPLTEKQSRTLLSPNDPHPHPVIKLTPDFVAWHRLYASWHKRRLPAYFLTPTRGSVTTLTVLSPHIWYMYWQYNKLPYTFITMKRKSFFNVSTSCWCLLFAPCSTPTLFVWTDVGDVLRTLLAPYCTPTVLQHCSSEGTYETSLEHCRHHTVILR